MALCAEKSAEEDKLALEVWLPELKSAVQEAQRCLEDCKRVRGLVSVFKLSYLRLKVEYMSGEGSGYLMGNEMSARFIPLLEYTVTCSGHVRTPTETGQVFSANLRFIGRQK